MGSKHKLCTKFSTNLIPRSQPRRERSVGLFVDQGNEPKRHRIKPSTRLRRLTQRRQHHLLLDGLEFGVQRSALQRGAIGPIRYWTICHAVPCPSAAAREIHSTPAARFASTPTPAKVQRPSWYMASE